MKIHALCTCEADAVDIRITAGQIGDAPVREASIDALDPRERIEQAAMDKASDRTVIGAKRDAKGSEPSIPPRAHRLTLSVYDHEGCKQRNKVERLFK